MRSRFCVKPAWSRLRVATPTHVESSFPWKAISMAVVSWLRRRPIDSGAGPAMPRGDSRGGIVRPRCVVAGWLSPRHLFVGNSSQRSSVSTTLPTVRAGSISPSTSMRTAAANRPRNRKSIVSGRMASTLVVSCFPAATIPTLSSSRAGMCDSSSLSWRLLNHEVSRDLPTDLH